jgi:hypothetical protein
VVAVSVLALAGCGDDGAHAPHRTATADLSGVRPIGGAARFHLPVDDTVEVRACRPALGERYGVHLELFGEGLVALFPAGIGTRPPRELIGGRIETARCYGPLVTIDPTGLVLLRPGTNATVGDVFDLWGQPLDSGRATAFEGEVRAYVNSDRVTGDPRAIPLRRHDEIVLEVGPFVPPHRTYEFPQGW